VKLLIAILAACAAILAPVAAAEDFRMQTPAGGYNLSVTSWRGMPFRTVVRQRFDFSCGSAALATLLTYHYGRPTDEERVFAAMWERGDQSSIRARGFSLLDMQGHLQAQGFQADGYRLSLDRLGELDTPAIAMISPGGYRHFVVIKGVRGNRVLVGDPAAGLMIYDRADFESLWNGVVFVIHGEGARGAFNEEREWLLRPRAPVRETWANRPIETLTRELPPLYQISPPPPPLPPQALAGVQ
jgi:predicted double-glycine peptidase